MNKIGDKIIGWYGVLAILWSYIWLSFGIFRADDAVYQVFNLTGALGVMYISLKKKAYQPAVLNIIWAIIAFVALFRLIS